MTTSDYKEPELPRRTQLQRLVHPKGYIGPVGLPMLILLGCIPFIMVLSRLLAYPGMQTPELIGLTLLQQFGSFLNQSLTLQWVPPVDRWNVLYVLMLPTAVLLITLARLTFGIRVLGLRAVLIAVGFQEIGIFPSLMLISVVVMTVVLVRPATRRIRLPLYARISVISCIVATIMVVALFIGPWMRSNIIWSVAFFPVVILAMLAESIAKTIDQDNALTAAWRLGWTVVLALLIFWISYTPSIREFALHFPELMISQLVAIILISEYLDFRLLHHWQANLGKVKCEGQAPFRVAVVRNRWNTDVIGHIGKSLPATNRPKSVQRVVNALRASGYTVKVFEGDLSLFRNLRNFLPPDPRKRTPGGLVLNLANGIQGKGRLSHLPSMLEMAGVAYTGADSISLAHMLDRYVLLTLLRQRGLITPKFQLVSNKDGVANNLEFPLVVRPRYEPEITPTIVNCHRELVDTVQHVVQQYAQQAIVESFLNSPDIRVSILGNDNIEFLPLLQVGSSKNDKLCPAPIDHALADRIREYARCVFIATGCRDYARIDVRLTKSGEPCIAQIHSLGLLARKGSFAHSAKVGGYSFQALLQRITELAWERYFDEEIVTVSKDQVNINKQLSSGLTRVKA